MAAPKSPQELLEVLRRSNLVEPAKLAAFVAAHPAGFGTPQALCDKLRADGHLTAFQVEQLLRGKHRGFFLGRYKILDRIGLGGMGQVFLAEHATMRRRVAIKVLPPDRAENSYSRERFLREARAAGQLDHPNVVRAFDFDAGDEVTYLVMEFVDGVTFQDLVERGGPLAPSRAAHYLLQAAHGLGYVHSHGLIHRDIKPANLLVDRAGVVKVLDLGLVRSQEDEDNLTRGEGVRMLGTADYLAPEQAIDCTSVDWRADTYALGATAYYLLVGRPPFEAESVSQKLIAHQMKPPTPLHELRPDVPAALSAVVARMLAKKPADRFADPGELIAALESLVTEEPPPPTERELPATGRVGALPGSVVLTAPRPSHDGAGSGINIAAGEASSGSAIRYHSDTRPRLDSKMRGELARAQVLHAITPAPAKSPLSSLRRPFVAAAFESANPFAPPPLAASATHGRPVAAPVAAPLDLPGLYGRPAEPTAAAPPARRGRAPLALAVAVAALVAAAVAVAVVLGGNTSAAAPLAEKSAASP
jgi:serine/threonine protein kinase